MYVPVAERIRQFRINLQQARWLPYDLGGRYVLVNVAGFRAELAENREIQLLTIWECSSARPAHWKRGPIADLEAVIQDNVDAYFDFLGEDSRQPFIIAFDVLPES